MEIVHGHKQFDLINADVTNHCNARCFFCFNDWDEFKPFNMDIPTFRNLLRLLPMMESKDFLISCWFEPTINPLFYDMLDLLPAEYRSKMYFTTNLVTKIDDPDIERMCRANVDHINISLETYDPEEYTFITGVKNTHFFENLEKIAAYGRQYGTDFHVITMLTKRNAPQFRELVERVHRELSPSVHEIRTPFFFVEQTASKPELVQELLTKDEIRAVREDVETLGYTHLYWDTRFTKENFQKLEKNPEPHRTASNRVHYQLRVNADGTARISNQKYGKLFDINAPDLLDQMEKELIVLQAREAADYLVDDPQLSLETRRVESALSFDNVILYDRRFLFVRGWTLNEADQAREKESERIAVLECDGRKIISKMRTERRKDIADFFRDPDMIDVGFTALFDLEGMQGKPFRIYSGYLYEKDHQAEILHQLYDSVTKETGWPPLPEEPADKKPEQKKNMAAETRGKKPAGLLHRLKDKISRK